MLFTFVLTSPILLKLSVCALLQICLQVLRHHGVNGFLSVELIAVPGLHHRDLALFVAAVLDDCVNQEGYVENDKEAERADDEPSLILARLLADAGVQKLLQLAGEKQQHEVGEDLEVLSAEVLEKIGMGVVHYCEQC